MVHARITAGTKSTFQQGRMHVRKIELSFVHQCVPSGCKTCHVCTTAVQILRRKGGVKREPEFTGHRDQDVLNEARLQIKHDPMVL